MAEDREYLERKFRELQQQVESVRRMLARQAPAGEREYLQSKLGALRVIRSASVAHTVVVKDMDGRELRRVRGGRLHLIAKPPTVMGGREYCTVSEGEGGSYEIGCGASRRTIARHFEDVVRKARATGVVEVFEE